tara:strand:+ start:156 stop:515 length:360 start_codon:yes stop_codon:yes gene_type:complete
MSIGFEDETRVIPSFKLPYWSVKRFYGLFLAHGLYFKTKSKRKRELRDAVSSLAVVYKEKVDTLDEIARYANVIEHAEQRDVSPERIHLNKLNTHLDALTLLEAHLNRYGIAYEHEVLI